MHAKSKVHKTAMIFKINIVKLIDKYSKLMRSSTTLGLFKYYYKDIKKFVIRTQTSLNT